METYLIEGTVHPERAQISMKFGFSCQHLASNTTASISVNIQLNKIVAWVDTEAEWPLYDLRNFIKTAISNELSVVGFLHGYAYELDVTRIVQRERDIDWVIGIDVPCIAERNASLDKEAMYSLIREKTIGKEGTLLHRCFIDLSMAMKHADDTGFYCYRAVEALRQHCIIKFGLPPGDRNKAAQWAKLREIAQCSETTTREIEAAAAHTRHGGISTASDQERARLFTITWDVVEGYIRNL